MPTDPKRSPKRGWRVGGDEEVKRPWRKDADASPTPSGRRWKIRWFWPLFLLFLATVGAFVWLILILNPPKPAYLVILGANYANNPSQPPNLHGWRSAETLRQFAENAGIDLLWWRHKLFGGGDLNTLTGKEALQNYPKWAEGLASRKEETILLYVTAHGGVDQRGTYLIPHDCQLYAPDDKQGLATVLRMKDLLDKLPKDKKKVVLLDTTATPAHWPSGQLHHDFVRKLMEELDRDHKETPNLLVLCANDRGERSWPSEEWGHSVFGYFVLMGLAGEADKDHTEKVDAAELIAYVKKHVEDWTLVFRDEVQTPTEWISTATEPRRLLLSVVTQHKPDVKSLSEQETKLRDSRLGKAWTACDSLWNDEVPHPAVYSPHLWRQYLETLLRLEQVVRSGDPVGNAGELQVALDTLSKKIREGRTCELTPQKALNATLSMRAALGHVGVWKDADLRLALLRQAKDNEGRKKEWKALRAALAVSDAAEPQLRYAVTSLLLRDLERHGDSNARQQVRELLTDLLPATDLRPGEVHYLRMLDHVLEGRNPGTDLIQLALGVRVLAEQTALAAVEPGAHPFSERVAPWIKARVTNADRERRLGEDWLFGETAENSAESKKHLEAAKKEYELAREIAGRVRDALEVQARVTSELPYYTHWLAAQRPTLEPADRERERKGVESRVEELEKLWTAVHQLSAQLRAPAESRVELLAKSAQEVKKEFDKLAGEFANECAKLAQVPAQHQFWHAIDAALTVPLIPSKQRMELVDRQRKITDKYKDSSVVTDPEIRRSARLKFLPEDSEASARRQGRLAVATLGQEWIDRKAGPKSQSSSYKNLHEMTLRPPNEGPWQSALNQAGWQIGGLFRALPAEVRTQAAQIEAKTWLSKPNPEEYQKGMAKSLEDAAALCRQLDGGAAESLPTDPVQMYRRWTLHELLLWQGQRVWLDHWEYENAGKSQPYYSEVANACMDSAQALALHGLKDPDLKDPGFPALRLAQVARARKELSTTKIDVRSSDEALARGEARALTTEITFTVGWNILPDSRVPTDAVPLCRLRTSPAVRFADETKRDELARLQPLANWSRKLVEHELKSPPLLEERDKPRTTPLRAAQNDPLFKQSATLEVLFRGRKIPSRTDLHLYLGPDVAAFHHPPPRNVGLAVRADESIQRGAVAIILDYSGSMASPKINEALVALEAVLGRLDGTLLSVWIFGHQYRKEKDPAKRTQKTEITEIRKLATWRQEEREGLLTKLREEYEPWHYTALVQSMKDARDQLLKDERGKQLYKTIVVLTDGEDTLWPPTWIKDNDANDRVRAAAIHQAMLDEFGPAKLGKERLVVNMVLFGNDAAERRRAENQFVGALKKLSPPGKWLVAEDGAKLAEQLREALRPQVRVYEGENLLDKTETHARGTPSEGYKVTYRTEKALDWSNPFFPDPAKVYHAEVHSHRQQISFNLGDRLLVNLHSREGRVQFERRLATDEYGTDTRFWKNGRFEGRESDWRLAVHKNQHDVASLTGYALDLLTTVENWRNVVPQNGLLQQHKPGLKWFELHAGGHEPPGLRWRNVGGYIAPTWGLHVPLWDRTNKDLAPPTLKAWWIFGEPDGAYVVLRHEANGDLQAKMKSIDKVVGIDVTVESIVPEDRKVEVAPGRFEIKPCMVVRLRHEPNKPGEPYRPIWVQLKRNIEGEEHYFYREPGKVTAVFWPVTNVREEPFTLHLVSVDAFKARAIHAELPLPRPMPESAGPPKAYLRGELGQ